MQPFVHLCDEIKLPEEYNIESLSFQDRDTERESINPRSKRTEKELITNGRLRRNRDYPRNVRDRIKSSRKDRREVTDVSPMFKRKRAPSALEGTLPEALLAG